MIVPGSKRSSGKVYLLLRSWFQSDMMLLLLHSVGKIERKSCLDRRKEGITPHLDESNLKITLQRKKQLITAF